MSTRPATRTRGARKADLSTSTSRPRGRTRGRSLVPGLWLPCRSERVFDGADEARQRLDPVLFGLRKVFRQNLLVREESVTKGNEFRLACLWDPPWYHFISLNKKELRWT